jgi:hypothetical protein
MLVPTKFTTLQESTIFEMRAILESKRDGENIDELLSRTLAAFEDALEFICAVDILYVLGALNVDASTGVVEYAA